MNHIRFRPRSRAPRFKMDLPWAHAQGFMLTHRYRGLKPGTSLLLADFPTVNREQAVGVLELMRERLLTDYETAA